MGQKPKVPFLDLKLQHEGLRGEIEEAVRRTIESTGFVLGPELSQFEQEFAHYCDCEHAVGTSSGTAALHLALLALGVGPGDEVITVPNTFIATVEAILYTGATPVLVDVDSRSYGMNPDLLERAITPRTRALIPVHIYGHPCDMEAIGAIAQRHGIFVVEDACQSHGATFMGRKTGSLGDIAAFSFYPTKNLGGIGDGGAVTTNDVKLADRIRALRHHGQANPNVFDEVGYNCRLDSIQAAVLGAKLPHLDAWTSRRRNIAARYRKGIRSDNFEFQSAVAGSEPVYYIFTVRHPRRDLVHEVLNSAGIGWGRHIVAPIHKQPGYRHLARDGETFPVSEALAAELVSLPVFPELTDEQVNHVVDVLGKVEVSV